ncbi:39S ribosomal protein L27, mitochondrial-like [Argiope bruennichi]|uniref:39S ribosomal protein L27, mitochondrial-like n=1 Tax=Argiope bruennichi TaxID=94029 RepID=UPI002494E133|nr:39S ribosomal protein L27, mitochondrial-like [Argiope bruennichi]
MNLISPIRTIVSATKNTINVSVGAKLRPALPLLFFERFFRRGVSQNTRQRRRPPGLKRVDGEFVRRGERLLDQFYLNFHPGLNVNIIEKNTLVAMREGRVMITCEKINPKRGNYVVDKYYGKMSAPVVYKRFIHVIPFPQSQKFKLVELI